MKNYLGKGDEVTLPAPTGGTVSGSVYLIGAVLGVAASTVAQTLPCVFSTKGAFKNIPKNTGEAYTAGDLLYWDNTNKRLTSTAGSNKKAGTAYADALSADTIAILNLNNYVI